MQRNVILVGDALDWLRKLPSESVNCVVTSPPYYRIRDYGISGQLGQERSPGEYVEKMVDVFRETRRVLRSDGTVWLNIADTYSAGGRGSGGSRMQASNPGSYTGDVGSHRTPGFAPKQMLLIPQRLSIALQDDGWWIRSVVIFYKPNPMPESVDDRCTRSYEYVFQMAKSEDYWFDQAAIREPHTTKPGKLRDRNTEDYIQGSYDTPIGAGARTWYSVEGRNKRDVWTIPVKTYKRKGKKKVRHYAVMPQKLAETCILAGCPPGGIVLDPFGGAGTTAVAARKLGRDYILIELSAKYAALAEERLRETNPYAPQHLKDGQIQRSLFEGLEHETD